MQITKGNTSGLQELDLMSGTDFKLGAEKKYENTKYRKLRLIFLWDT